MGYRLPISTIPIVKTWRKRNDFGQFIIKSPVFSTKNAPDDTKPEINTKITKIARQPACRRWKLHFHCTWRWCRNKYLEKSLVEHLPKTSKLSFGNLEISLENQRKSFVAKYATSINITQNILVQSLGFRTVLLLYIASRSNRILVDEEPNYSKRHQNFYSETLVRALRDYGNSNLEIFHETAATRTITSSLIVCFDSIQL